VHGIAKELILVTANTQQNAPKHKHSTHSTHTHHTPSKAPVYLHMLRTFALSSCPASLKNCLKLVSGYSLFCGSLQEYWSGHLLKSCEAFPL
jgi:hypothetical protein